ncbi:MAG: ADP-ribosylglycohydrolase family protein [Phycisphaeraceae bacterium]
MPAMTRDQRVDRAHGMLLLAAYADALGAPRELDGLAGKPAKAEDHCRLLPASSFHTADGSPWNIWPPSDITTDRLGVVTDDTEFRHLILDPYLATCLKSQRQPSWHGWIFWIRNLKPKADEPSWLTSNRTAQINDWLSMAEAHQSNTTASFYKPDTPIIFGLFTGVHLAITVRTTSPNPIYDRFSRWCPLDQGHAPIITALWACLIAEAAQTHDWSLNTLADHASSLTQKLDASATVQYASKIAFDIGNNKVSDQDFIDQFTTSIYLSSDLDLNPEPADRNFDPLYLWAQLIACAAQARDPRHLLSRLVSLPGDTDTVASLTGLIIGAGLGYQKLINQTADGWGADLKAVETCLHDILDIDLQQSAAQLVDLIPPGTITA